MIACAMAHRANKIAYAMVRDQTGYEPDPLGLTTPIAASSIAASLAGSAGPVNLERPQRSEDERG